MSADLNNSVEAQVGGNQVDNRSVSFRGETIMRLDLYNNVDTPTILKAIGIEEDKIPRIRGVGIDDGKILIHTRTGGGNREQYDDADDFISSIDHYIADYKNPTSWAKDTPENEKIKRIAELEAQKKEVLETKAYTNDYLRDNPYFLHDEDEEFDCTYANFWYRIPEALTEELLSLEDKEAKAVLGDAEVAIPLMFGDKDAQKTAQERLDSVTTAASTDPETGVKPVQNAPEGSRLTSKGESET